MGKSYYVPRSVKGETRILIIFTVKSFIFTLAFGLIGGGIWALGSNLFGMGMFPGIAVTILFGGFGYLIGTAKIPDSPIMGPFQKAGGEYVSEIIKRFITFKSRKKIYLYNYNRENIINNKNSSNNKGGKK